MNFRALFLSVASVAAFAPCVSHAATQNSALSACTRAFAARLSTTGSVPAFKLKYIDQPGSAIDEYYSGHKYTFDLQAQNSRTGAVLARATCTTNMRGTQVALSAPPMTLGGPLATFASR
ncbi:MAG TPA: hypothetical protein VIY68_17450 [Steroidobacteraceae bacterium]